MHAFGMIGKNGSGKSTVCQYLKNSGFSVFSLSDCIRDEATRLGQSHDRDTLTTISNQLKLEKGTDYFAQYTYEKAIKLGLERCVFDSIRHVDECRFLSSKGIRLIAIESPVHLRYERIFSRNEARDHIDFETFKQQDERESSGESFGQNLDACLALADMLLNNSGDMADLEKKIDGLMHHV